MRAGSKASRDPCGPTHLLLACSAVATLTVKQHHKQLTVGTLSFSLTAGIAKNFTLKLNPTGRKLVKHADLHVTLTLTLSEPAGARVVVAMVHVTIKRHS